jgi:hypothetical protein
MGRHQPALLGGLFIGVLSSLPVVGWANLCCCLWVVSGGVLTAYLQQQNRPEPVDTAEAVLGGLLAGLVGALLTIAVQTLLINYMGPLWQDQLRTLLDQNPELAPEARDFVLNLTTGRALFVVLAAIVLPIYAVAAMLGALLGLVFFRKKTPPVAAA